VADIDHFDERKDFTIDQIDWEELPAYFDKLHNLGMKTVLILDPALVVNDSSYWPYTTGKEKGVFIEWPDNNPDFNDTQSNIMLGYVIKIDYLLLNLINI
jgi:alpha-glucosidase (family GH31 glycosyl hydrolase)